MVEYLYEFGLSFQEIENILIYQAKWPYSIRFLPEEAVHYVLERKKNFKKGIDNCDVETVFSLDQIFKLANMQCLLKEKREYLETRAKLGNTILLKGYFSDEILRFSTPSDIVKAYDLLQKIKEYKEIHFEEMKNIAQRRISNIEQNLLSKRIKHKQITTVDAYYSLAEAQIELSFLLEYFDLSNIHILLNARHLLPEDWLMMWGSKRKVREVQDKIDNDLNIQKIIAKYKSRR